MYRRALERSNPYKARITLELCSEKWLWRRITDPGYGDGMLGQGFEF